jgi:biopolymer transport protein TolR
MSRKARCSGYLAEINVVPMVDVVLVLLIIFMVSAPFMTSGLEVDLPRTRTVASLPTDSDHVLVTVQADGSIYLDSDPVALEVLSAALGGSGLKVFIRADASVPHGRVVRVMGEIKAAGIDRLGFVAEEADGEGAGKTLDAAEPDGPGAGTRDQEGEGDSVETPGGVDG